MLARVVLAIVLLMNTVAYAADLAIRAVVVKSARVSVHGTRAAVSNEAVQVTVLPAGEGGVRVLFTP